jgi:hypothetical protein
MEHGLWKWTITERRRSMSGKNYGSTGFQPKRRGSRGTGMNMQEWLGNAEGYAQAMTGSFNAQASVDIRAIATVDIFLRKCGYEARGVSELLRNCVRLIFEQALREGIEPIVEIDQALDYLDEMRYSLAQFETYRRKRIQTARRAEALHGDRAPIVEGLTIKAAPEYSCRPDIADIPDYPEDEYDKWARALMAQLLEDGLTEEEAVQESLSQAKRRKMSCEPSEHIPVWEFKYRYMTPQGAREAAERKVQEIFLKADREQIVSGADPRAQTMAAQTREEEERRLLQETILTNLKISSPEKEIA